MKKSTASFEALSVSDANKLIGGFSAALSQEEPEEQTPKTNNCKGGNYKAGCGKKNKHKYHNKLPNSNCVGNCVQGCGNAPKH